MPATAGDRPPRRSGCILGLVPGAAKRRAIETEQFQGPALWGVPPLSPTVRQDVVVVAPGSHEGVSQKRQSVECPVLVNGPGKSKGIGRPPASVDHGRPDRVQTLH